MFLEGTNIQDLYPSTRGEEASSNDREEGRTAVEIRFLVHETCSTRFNFRTAVRKHIRFLIIRFTPFTPISPYLYPNNASSLDLPRVTRAS